MSASRMGGNSGSNDWNRRVEALMRTADFSRSFFGQVSVLEACLARGGPLAEAVQAELARREAAEIEGAVATVPGAKGLRQRM